MREMNLWEKEMKRKEEALLNSPEPYETQDVPPVRESKLSKVEIEASSDENLLKQRKREESLFEKDQGNVFVKQGKWEEAINHYTMAINSYAWDATFYANRALCFLKLKKWSEAETDCTTALQIDNTYDKAYYRRALALKGLNQLKQAKDDLLEVLRLNPDNQDARNEINKMETSRTELINNEIKFHSHVNKKELALVKKEKGNAFVKLRNYQSAIECYTESCGLDPEEPSHYLNRALCFLKLNEPRKVILDCCRVLEMDPKNVKALYRRASAHEKLDNLSKAHDDLLLAFGLDPSNADVEKLLNKVERSLGLRPEPEEMKIPVQPEETSVIANTKPNRIESTPRITGERFLKLGGYPIKPDRKPAHMLSKKPLKTIDIVDKTEKSEFILESALSELNTNDQLTSEDSVTVARSNESVSNDRGAPISEVKADDFPVPKTFIQFKSSWDSLETNPEQQFVFLKKIGGNNFPSLFKDALESYTFSDILNVLKKYCIEQNEPAYQFLDGLSKVRRFSALLLFATEDDNKSIELLLKRCEDSESIPKDQMDALKSRYHCQ